MNTITAALGAGAGGADQAGFVDAQVRAFGADYSTLMAGIRGRAPSARIIVLNLPNLAALPYLGRASLQQRQAAQRAHTREEFVRLVADNVGTQDRATFLKEFPKE